MTAEPKELVLVIPVPALASRWEAFRAADALAHRIAAGADGVAQPVAWRLGWDRHAGRVASGVLRIVPLPTVESVLAELEERGFTVPAPAPEGGKKLQPGGMCRSGRHVITLMGIVRTSSGRRYCAACRDEAAARRVTRRAGGAS